MKVSLFYTIVFLLISHIASAKIHADGLSGRVVDGYGKPVADANIFVLKSDSTLFKADLTDDKGGYDITPIPQGTYILKIVATGYKEYSSGTLSVTPAGLSMSDIALAASGTDLKEVSVRAQKPFVEVHPDMLVVNVENSIVSAGSSALEVLQRSPGVTVDQNDNISLKGKQGVNIMINGKIQPISADQLANILKSMPANSIDKIEIISNPSARYDAAGTAGIINIVLKKDQRMGMNGTANIGYGQGVYPKANAGLGLNYRNEKVSVYANYNYAFREGFNRLILSRDFTDNNVTDFRYHEDHISTFPYNAHSLATGIDYNLSPHTTVGAALNADLIYYTTKGQVNTMASNPAMNADVIDSTAVTNNNAANHWYDYTVNANLRHTFDSTGRQLTVDADYGRYWNRNTQDLVTQYYKDDMQMRVPYLLHGDVEGLTQIRSLKADFSDPMKNGLKLDAGVKASFVTADNQPSFYDRSNGGNVYDTGKSDHFIYNENINAAYINAAKDMAKWSMQLGLRLENTNIWGEEKVTGQKIDRSYTQLFPSLAVQRHIDANNDLGLTLSRRIERPDYRQLNPYKLYTDPTTLVQGNPYLNPALTYSAELSHTYKQRFITTISYSITKDVIAEVLAPGDNRVTIQTEQNIPTMNYFGISFAYPFQIFKWWSNVTNANAYYSQYVGNLDNTNLRNGQPTFELNSNNSFILPKDFSAELGLIYQAAQAYGFMHLQPQWWVNAGIQKNLFGRKATIRVNASDIFSTAFTKATSYYNGYTESFTVRRDMTQVNISFIYRFGNRNVGQVRRHSSGAEDEMRRAGSGGA